MDDFIIQDGELYHHGVKGMKWGVRRTPTQLGHRPKKKKSEVKKFVENAWKKHQEKKAAKKAAKEEAEAIEALKKKSPSEMSDAELKKRVERMRLEREAMQLDKDIKSLTPDKTSPGKKLLKKLGSEVIAPAATQAGKDVLTAYLKQLGMDAISGKKKGGDDGDDGGSKPKKEKKTKDKKPKDDGDGDNGSDKSNDSFNFGKVGKSDKTDKVSKNTVDFGKPDKNDKTTKFVRDKVYVSDYTVDDVSSSVRSSGQKFLSSPEILALPAPRDDD